MKRSKKKKIKQIEAQDSAGISRKKWNHTISLPLYVGLKIFGIVMIPICYFVYSPLLLLCMIYYVALFFFAIMAERRINTSVIKENHIKLMKFDSAIAMIVIVIAFVGTFMSTSNVKSGQFDGFQASEAIEVFKGGKMSGMSKNNWWSNVESYLTNFGTLLTGERNAFENSFTNNMFADAPEGFNATRDDFLKSFDGARTPEVSMSNLPISYVFSSLLTSCETILIFSVSGVGVLSLVLLYFKKRKFAVVMNENITDDFLVDESEIDRILSFGEDVVQEEFLCLETGTLVQNMQVNVASQEQAELSKQTQEKIEDNQEDIKILDENYNLNDHL